MTATNMEQSKQDNLLYANLDDLIFENRNKEYGAYYLRQIYHKHIVKSVITAFIFFVLFVSSPLIYNYIKGKVDDANKVKVVEYTTLAEPPPIDKNQPPPPPVEPPPPLKSTVKFTPPIIKPDEEVTEEPPPAVEELKEADPGTKTVEGNSNGVDASLLEGNGKEAIDVWKNNHDISLILMDVMMPEMDGYEAIKEIRKLENGKNIPIISLTARTQADEREKCISSGASDYASKPIDADLLISLSKIWILNSDKNK